MKKVLLILSLHILAIGVNAQGNLQFNQVINEMLNTNYYSGPNGGAGTSLEFTVPAGKVWKVEGFYQAGEAPGGTSYIIKSTAPSNLIKRNGDVNVLWLAPGTYAVRFFWGCGWSVCSGTVCNTINAIEFNIIQ